MQSLELNCEGLGKHYLLGNRNHNGENGGST